MKAKVRIIEQKYDDHGFYSNYKHYFIELLKPRRKDSKELRVYASIRWQTDRDHEEKNPDNKWYGMHLLCDTDKWEDIADFAKVAKFIRENCEYCTPAEVLSVLNAERYIHYGQFIPASWAGRNKYHVNVNGAYWCDIYETNEVTANKALAKMIKAEHWEHKTVTLEFESIVPAA